MAQKKISELNSAGTLTLSADLLPIVNEGATRKITIDEFLGYVPEVWTDLQELSGNWQDTATVVQANSASWAVDSTTDAGVRALSGGWQDTLTIVQSNSASWAVDSTIDTEMRDLSSKWEDSSTVVQANSASWAVDTSIDTQMRDLSATWQSTYTDVASTSANWNLANSYAVQYASVSSTYLTGGQISGDLTVVGSITANNIELTTAVVQPGDTLIESISSLVININGQTFKIPLLS